MTNLFSRIKSFDFEQWFFCRLTISFSTMANVLLSSGGRAGDGKDLEGEGLVKGQERTGRGGNWQERGRTEEKTSW